ncbi:MAG TPA: hypothetical protein VJS15_06180 [Allosphingosinicella sp.]|nr:hypothetical protein [Allosphingosinicella sp.]
MTGWRTRLAAMLLMAGLFVGTLTVMLYALSAVWVRDPEGQVIRAAFVNAREAQALWDLPGGLFVGIPRLEGEVEIVCRDGSRHRWGYVTGWADGSYRVEPGCRLREA